MDRINKNDFVGKTIKDIDFTTVNEIKFYFTDDTEACLESIAEIPSLGLYGIQQIINSKT